MSPIPDKPAAGRPPDGRRRGTPRRRSAGRADFVALFPGALLPLWLGDLSHAVGGRVGRWIGVAVGVLVSVPYLLWASATHFLLKVVGLLIRAL